jgi:hypothetical protein
VDTFETKARASTTGTLEIAGGFLFSAEPKTGKFTANVQVDVTATAEVKFVAEAEYVGKKTSWSTPVGKPSKIFQSYTMLGYWPVQIMVTIQPYVWVDVTSNAVFEASFKVEKTATLKGGITIDGDAKSMDPNFSWDTTPITVTPEITGELNMEANYRLGPRITISCNGVPVKVDAAFALYMTGTLALNNGCLDGSLEMGAAADISSNVIFDAPNPQDMAYEACLTAASVIESSTVGKVGTCLAKVAGIKTASDFCADLKQEQLKEVSTTVSCSTDQVTQVGKDDDWFRFPLASIEFKGGFCVDPSGVKMTSSSVQGKIAGCHPSFGSHGYEATNSGVVACCLAIYLPSTVGMIWFILGREEGLWLF